MAKVSKKRPKRATTKKPVEPVYKTAMEFNLEQNVRRLITHNDITFRWCGEIATVGGRVFWLVFDKDDRKSYLDPACVKLLEYEAQANVWTKWKHPDGGEISYAKAP